MLDLGTGSGAIALAIASGTALRCRVTGVDISRGCRTCCCERTRSRWHCPKSPGALGSWFDAVAEERFDMVVANPPYVAASDRELRAHSPPSPRLRLPAVRRASSRCMRSSVPPPRISHPQTAPGSSMVASKGVRSRCCSSATASGHPIRTLTIPVCPALRREPFHSANPGAVMIRF